MTRTFATGANRNGDENKLKYSGFLSPRVLQMYAEYMHIHRKLADGTLRPPDNWKRGLPIETYQDSMVRHLIQAWGVWEGEEVFDDKGNRVTVEDALLGVMFNVQGYLFELSRKDEDRNN